MRTNDIDRYNNAPNFLGLRGNFHHVVDDNS